jgi:hypothetical protein
MGNLQEQQLSLQLCIGAPMQREELSDSRNRQAAENDRPQNEDQIWQRGPSNQHARPAHLHARLLFSPAVGDAPRLIVGSVSKTCPQVSSPLSSCALMCLALRVPVLIAGWVGEGL